MNNFPTNIQDYVKIYRGVFPSHFCDQTIKSLQSAEWRTHQFYSSEDEYIYRGNDFEHTSENIPEQKIILEALWHVINQYVMVDLSKYYERFNWFASWRGYTNIDFHKYDVNTDMKLHCDHIHDMFDGERKGVPILTVIGLLNEDFEGGDFLLWEKEKIDLKQGDIIVFPSNFMYPHEVSTILSGNRYSFVSWVW